MTYAEYPAALPLPAADYNAKLVTNVASTPFSSGRVRRRRLGWGKAYSAKLSWELSPEEYDLWIGWWEFSLLLGVVPFSVSMATGSLLGPHSVQLTDDPEVTHLGYFWKVSCDAMVLEKPEFTADQVRLYEGGSSPATFPAFEDALDQVVNSRLPTYL